MTNFIVGVKPLGTIACGGVEYYADFALMRSIVVARDARGVGLGKTVVAHLLAECRTRAIRSVVLLTTTAEHYFSGQGFAPITRTKCRHLMSPRRATEPLVAAHVPRDHPVVTCDYSLFTIAIHDMVERIAGWLDDQIDGATIFGPSRFGKSSAVDHWLQRLLSERHGGYVPLVIWSHTDSGSSQAVGRFYAHLLEASGHRLAQARRNPLERQIMLMERWIELAAQGGGRFLVLVIDEAQGMSQREWLWLVELHSLLEKQRVRLCIFDCFVAVLR
ncbi:GNAT family N-acetyltransferase [Paraburkholderia sp. BL27I4N3]|uniref:GNAT family N-acetyltransferase n=1 Tax=Paraburkholderia sp. BL27I4N3 TaxID=1938805 RepID=UPI0021616475|nr:GNAT family N-acetyltransferase [Paraburkholderia sp. BL27I4N3]